jgi:hypothetical protein
MQNIFDFFSMFKMNIDCVVRLKSAFAWKRIDISAALAHLTSARHRLARAQYTTALNMLFQKLWEQHDRLPRFFGKRGRSPRRLKCGSEAVHVICIELFCFTDLMVILSCQLIQFGRVIYHSTF